MIKNMNKFIVVLMLLFPYLLFPYNSSVKVNNNNLKIYIYSPGNNIDILTLDTLNYIQLNTHSAIFPENVNGTLIDKLFFQIALPESRNYQLNYKIHSEKKLNTKIPRFLNSFESSIQLKELGLQRGLLIGSLKIQPFTFDNVNNSLTMIDSVEITITFDTDPILKNKNIPQSEIYFFKNIINKQHIPKFINSSSKKFKNSPEIQSRKWYEPNIDYFKISTSKDGIAKISMADLLVLNSKLTGKNSNYIHLIFKGEEQPVFILNDNNNTLDPQDEIFFIGSRGKGDTTWFNNYSDTSVFYLYYDESYTGMRFNEFPNTDNPAEYLEYVKISKHIEKENYYLHGYFPLQWDIETIHREGWLWQVINSDKNNLFSTSDFFLSYDTLTLDIKLVSAYWNESLLTKHNLELWVNNSEFANLTLDTGHIRNFSFKIPDNKLISGINKFDIINTGNRNSQDENIIPDDFGIDYYEISSKVKPYAFKGHLDFKIDKKNHNINLILPGFASSDIYIIDRVGNHFEEANGISGTSFAIGTKSDENPYSAIVINDHSKIINDPGLHIAVLKSPEFNQFEFKTFTVLNNSVLDYLNNIPPGSVLQVIYNSDNEIPTNIKEKLKTYGSSHIDNVTAGKSWTLCVKTDQINSAVEDYTSSKYSNISGFFTHNGAKSFALDKNLIGSQNYDLLTCDNNNIEKAAVSLVNKTNLTDKNIQSDAIFITHSKFNDAAEKLAKYRREQGINVFVVDIEDIYKEFNFGTKSPHAIKSFLKYTYNNWQKPMPQFVLLIGDANWDARQKAENSVNYDYIPSYGWPVSDYWYTLLDSAEDNIHDMIIGRIPATTSQEVLNVLNKNIEYDNAAKRPWMKRFLSITGGGDDSEREVFKESMDAMLGSYWMHNEICGDTLIVAKKSKSVVGQAEANEIIDKINKGVVWVNFYGHGSPSVFDIDGWHAEKLDNKGYYPFFTTISCNTAAFAEKSGTSRDETYITINDRGFIAAGGSTNLGVTLPGMQILTYMLNLLADTLNQPQTFSELLQNAKIPMLNSDILTVSFAYQFVYIGDPLTKIRISNKPDLYFISDDIAITNYNNNKIISEIDSFVKLEAIIYNNGFRTKHPVDLQLLHTFNNHTDTLNLMINDICYQEYCKFDSIKVYNKPGIHNIKIFIMHSDTTFLAFEREFEVLKTGLYTLDPLPFWNINADNMHFRFIDPKQKQNTIYEFNIAEINKIDSSIVIYKSKNTEINISENYIDWFPDTILSEDKNYYLKARIVSTEDSIYSNWLIIPFYVNSLNIQTVSSLIKENTFNNCIIENFKIKNYQNEKVLMFDNYSNEFFVKSVKGNDTATRYCEIVYDDKIYVYTAGPYNAPVGINLIVVSAKDGNYITTRHYNTWDGENSSRDLVNFLTDSVDNGDWVFIASCGGAWRMFYHTGITDPEATGSFYSFKETLKNYGSELVVQIPEENDIPMVSFAFAGRKGNPTDLVFESISLDGSPVKISGEIHIKPLEGKIRTPDFGPANQWLNCSIDIERIDSEASSTLSVIGLNDNIYETIISDVNTHQIDLSFINALKYPKLALEYKVKRNNNSIEPIINNIKCTFRPAAELAVSKSNSYLLSDSVYRGEPAIYNYKIENISLRSNAETNITNIQMINQTGNELHTFDTINTIAYNHSVSLQDSLETSAISENNIIKTIINSAKSINELYNFNNFHETLLKLKKDYEKPYVDIYFDGVMIFDSFYVAMAPHIEIRLFDNSYEPVDENSEPIKVRLNGYLQDSSNTKSYKLELVNKELYKAFLSFDPDTIFEYDNTFEVYFQDASGNKDTVDYHIFTSLNADIDNPITYPNPFSKSMKFVFDYKAPDENGKALINIFDITGRKVKTLTSQLKIGENIIEWDGTDKFGSAISPGVYLYSIKIESTNYTEPKTGKFKKGH
jgi:hypothetical protein